MGSITILLPVFAVFLVVYAVDTAAASSRCPPPSAIYVYSKHENCHSDAQCPSGKVCCVTPARNKACVQAAFGTAAQYYDKGKKTGTGLYCGNKKCSPSERCVKDQSGRPVCRR